MLQKELKGIDWGELLVISGGSMFAGKTEELLREIKRITVEEEIRNNIANKEGTAYTQRTIGAFKSALDGRYNQEDITSHDLNSYPATAVQTLEQIEMLVEEHDYRIVIIEEAQFFNEKDKENNYKIISTLNRLISQNRWVIACGLSKDFKGEPFGPMGDILAIADDITFLKSVCVACGSPATLPQRLIDGKPAHYQDPVVMVGAKESYEPRCRNCHEVNYQKRQEKTVV